MAKLLINENNKLLVGSGGKAYAITNLDELKGATPPVNITAAAGKVLRLTRYGKCEQNGTPTPNAPVDIVCNNGELRYGKPLTLDPTRISAYINEKGYWLYSSDSYSIAVPVEVGTKVAIRLTNTDISVVGSIFRCGFRNSTTPDWSSSSATPLSQVYRGTPQEREYVELTADRPYLIIQLASARAAHIISSGYLVVSKQEIYTDGTPEVLTVQTNNLVDVAHLTPVNLAYSGTKLVTNAERYGYYIRVKPSTKYTISINRDKTGAYLNICDTASVPANNVSVVAYNTMDGTTSSKTITTKANTNYLYVYTAYLSSGFDPFTQGEFQIEEGQMATPYAPYHRETVSVPMLLGVGDYKDEQEIIQGIKTGKVGIKVFDGTENWRPSSSGGNIYILTSAVGVNLLAICTHFQKISNTVLSVNMPNGSFKGHPSNAILYFKYEAAGSVADFKAWLTSQYAAGTPVIVIYPLATPTTEQLTPQPLTTVEGTNTITDVAAVSNPEFDILYKI